MKDFLGELAECFDTILEMTTSVRKKWQLIFTVPFFVPAVTLGLVMIILLRPAYIFFDDSEYLKED